jgi:maltose 6'-phosphate phosphatase
MPYVKLQSVRNVISRTMHGVQQELSFTIRIANLAYQKRVDVHWWGEDGQLRIQPACYQYRLDDQREVWQAGLALPLTHESSIPGNIQLAVRYECGGVEYWDNNNGMNYQSDADSGVIVYEGVPLHHFDYNPHLQDGEVSHPVDVAVNRCCWPGRVAIHWTTDRWRTQHVTPCFYRHNHWDQVKGSSARNPNRYGWGIWAGRLPVQHAYRVEYAIESEHDGRSYWDNNAGRNYCVRRGITLRMLTLNLHCYQEPNQDYKFTQIARSIQDLNIDVVCLQEVGENWNNGAGDWGSNAARIINERLPTPYFLHADWSHLGFDRFREGVAILSRYPFTATDAGYVSNCQNPTCIDARKVVMAQIHVPYFGLVNVFSAHLSWPSGGFYEQFDRLRDWANCRHNGHVTATLIGGDFNIKAGSDSYRHIVNTSDLEDQYLRKISPQAFNKIFRERCLNVQEHLSQDGRIDYIFLKRHSPLHVVDAKELYTDRAYGRVSDHTGYLVEFELE